jgi:hypothetical protein
VYVDPAGFLLFGPTLGVEVGGLQGHLSGTAYVRWFSEGLLSQQFFLNQGRGDTFDFSYGGGARGRYYFFGNLAGPHAGFDLEYLASHIEDHADLVTTNSQYFIPAAEGGYRLPFLGHCYADASAALGYAIRVGSGVDNLPGGTEASRFTASDDSKIYATASLDLGLYF